MSNIQRTLIAQNGSEILFNDDKSFDVQLSKGNISEERKAYLLCADRTTVENKSDLGKWISYDNLVFKMNIANDRYSLQPLVTIAEWFSIELTNDKGDILYASYMWKSKQLSRFLLKNFDQFKVSSNGVLLIVPHNRMHEVARS